jgi:flagellar biosynthesis GTPase FlhF
MTALFTINGIGYNTNEKGNRFFKIEDEKATRIGKAEYEAAYEQYTNDAADEELEFNEEEAIREAKEEMEQEEKKEMAEEIKMETEAQAEVQEQAEKEEKKSKKSRSLKKAAKIVEIDGKQIGLTEKHLTFLEALPGCSYWDHGIDSAVWVFALVDTGMNPMTVGAMVSTLREKGLLLVGLNEVQNMNGRTRKEKYIEFTDEGKKVLEALGIQ